MGERGRATPMKEAILLCARLRQQNACTREFPLMIEFHNVRLTYKNQNIFDHANLMISEGEFV